MKKILSLLLVSSSIFSMQLDIVRFEEKAAAVKSISKKMHIEPQMELNTVRFNTQAVAAKSDNKKMLIEHKSVFVPNRLGSVELSHSKKGFCVHQDDKKHVIQKYFTDPTVRNITKDQLQRFLEVGYLSLNQMDNGEFSLKANGRINGGGPLLGSAMYWVTKSLCYAVGATATIATVGGAVVAVTATGGAAAPALAATTTLVGNAAVGTVGVVAATAGVGGSIATTAGVVTVTAATGGLVGATAVATGTAVTVVAGATSTAMGVAVGNAAVTTTAAVVSSAGGIGATIAGIEAVSLAVGTFFGMLPTP